MLVPAALLVLLGQAPIAAVAAPVPDPGVALALAHERALRVSAVRYDVALSIPGDASVRVSGEETIRFRLRNAASPLALDFQQDSSAVRSVVVNGNGAGWRVANGHILLPAGALRAGENEVRVAFLAGDAPLNRAPDYLYTLFVPARASMALPVFDQPDLKARFTLSLELPDDWRSVSNSPEIAGPAGRTSMAAGRRTVRFAETRPIPTYLFGFAVGKWRVEAATRDGRTIRMFHRELDSAKVARNRAAVFDLVARSIAWMERYTGIPYPFPKYDLVLVPSFQFGGMEHPGAILYNASALLLDETATQNQQLGRASVIAHETAHMWFGDLVTMRWFDDVWMKEVFANFMAAKIVNPAFPTINHELRFLLAHYPAAYAVDRTAGTHPIRQRLDNLNEAGQLYGPIIYEKAPIVMRMLEQLVGEDRFRRGVRRYLSAHEYGNAGWPELVAELHALAPERHLREWSRTWVEEAGRPTLTIHRAVSPAGVLARLTIDQGDPAGRARSWAQPIVAALVYGDSARGIPAFLGAGSVAVPAARGLRPPDFALPNGAGRAYGRVQLERPDRESLLRALPRLRDPVLRAAGWLDAWEALVQGEVTAEGFLAAARLGLDHEPDEQLTQRLLAYTSDAYWHFLSDAHRQALAQPLEALLWRKLGDAPTTSRKSAFFSTLRSVALTPATVARLRSVWARDTTIPGLPLSEQDYTTLALELAVRGLPGADTILAAQQERIHDPDRRARLAFVRPALALDAATRDAWFASLRDPGNRTHEPWVLEGLAYLNHPLRQSASLRYVRPALDLLEEVRRTGDIFFPARWSSAVLSGHTSPEAARVVRAFLAEHPGYPERLRQLVLQAADGLFRAAAVQSSS